LSGADQAFKCDECTEELRKARNCEEKYSEKTFRFQIGNVERRIDIQEKFISECPTGYVSQFSQMLFKRYIETKLRNKLGFTNKEPRKIFFEAYSIFANSIQEYEKFESKKLEKENRRKGKK